MAPPHLSMSGSLVDWAVDRHRRVRPEEAIPPQEPRQDRGLGGRSSWRPPPPHASEPGAFRPVCTSAWRFTPQFTPWLGCHRTPFCWPDVLTPVSFCPSSSVCITSSLPFPFLSLCRHFLFILLFPFLFPFLFSFRLPSDVSPTPSHTTASPDLSLMSSIRVWKNIFTLASPPPCPSPTPHPTPHRHLSFPSPLSLFCFSTLHPNPSFSASLLPFLCICCSSDPIEASRPNGDPPPPNQAGATLLISGKGAHG